MRHILADQSLLAGVPVDYAAISGGADTDVTLLRVLAEGKS